MVQTVQGRTWDVKRFIDEFQRRLTNLERRVSGFNREAIADTGWQNIALQTGFTNAGPSPAAVRQIGHVVYFRGRVDRDAGEFPTSYEVWGTLPAGFEPPEEIRLPLAPFASVSNRNMLLRITAGSVSAQAGAVGAGSPALFLRGSSYPIN